MQAANHYARHRERSFCRSEFRVPSSAFTLIEVMLAIAIMAIICGTIYQFTATVMRTSTISLRTDAQEQAFAGLRRLFDAQFAALPTNETGIFIGLSVEDEHGHRDALQLVCPAGNAVLTPDAKGLYSVTIGLDEKTKGSGRYTLVMDREPWTSATDDLAHLNGGVTITRNVLPSDTVRLLEGVRSLQFSFYDPRLNAWQDKWNDDTLIPSLVRIRLGMENSGAPYEFTEHVPSGGIRRGLPTTLNTNPGMSGNKTVPGTNGTVPVLPPGLTVPPPPPASFTPPQLPPGLQPPNVRVPQ